MTIVAMDTSDDLYYTTGKAGIIGNTSMITLKVEKDIEIIFQRSLTTKYTIVEAHLFLW